MNKFVLCSDGVGHTGTFCALMLCYEHILAEHMADVFCIIKTIRAQRPGMVENLVRKKIIIFIIVHVQLYVLCFV